MSGSEREAKAAVRLGRRANMIVAFIWVIIGLAIWYETRNLPYVARFGPGAGFLTFWLGAGFVTLGVALLARYWFRPPQDGELELPSGEAVRQMVLVVGGLVLFSLFADQIGFIIGLTLLAFFQLVFVERKRLLHALFVAGVIGFGMWLLFERVLALRLPAGLLGLLFR